MIHCSKNALKTPLGSDEKVLVATNHRNNVVVGLYLWMLSALLLANPHAKSEGVPQVRYDANALKYMWHTALLILAHRKGVGSFPSVKNMDRLPGRQATQYTHLAPPPRTATQKTVCVSPAAPHRSDWHATTLRGSPRRPTLLDKAHTACGNCGVERNAMPVCARCRSQRYCSFRCLQQHQPVHMSSGCGREL